MRGLWGYILVLGFKWDIRWWCMRVIFVNLFVYVIVMKIGGGVWSKCYNNLGIGGIGKEIC